MLVEFVFLCTKNGQKVFSLRQACKECCGLVYRAQRLYTLVYMETRRRITTQQATTASSEMALSAPGLVFVGRILLSVLCLYIVATLATYLAAKLGVVVSAWSLLGIVAVAIPLALTAHVQLSQFKQRRQAASIGAHTVPCLRGRWIGNVDLLLEFLNRFKAGYPGDGINELTAQAGTTMNLRFLFEDHIFTVDPNCIKVSTTDTSTTNTTFSVLFPT